MTPLEMIAEWRKGCSCAPNHPAECEECTDALIGALEHKFHEGNQDIQRFAVLAELFTDHAVALGRPYLETLDDVRGAMDYLIEQRNAAKDEV